MPPLTNKNPDFCGGNCPRCPPITPSLHKTFSKFSNFQIFAQLPSRYFYKNPNFVLLPIYEPSTPAAVDPNDGQTESITEPSGTSKYPQNTEFLTTESAIFEHPDDARQVPDITEDHYDITTAIYPGVTKIPVTQLNPDNPGFQVGVDPSGEGGFTGYPKPKIPENPLFPIDPRLKGDPLNPGNPNFDPESGAEGETGYPNTNPNNPVNPGVHSYPDPSDPGFNPNNPETNYPDPFDPGRPAFKPFTPNDPNPGPDPLNPSAPGIPNPGSQGYPNAPTVTPEILTPDFRPEFGIQDPDVFEEFPPSEASPRQCLKRTCTQIVSGRNLGYGRALQIIQDEEYLQATDLDVIRRWRYKRSSGLELQEVDRTIMINDMLDFNSTFSTDTLAKTGLAGILFGLLYLSSKNEKVELPQIPNFPLRPPNRPSRPKRPKKKKKPEKLRIKPGQAPPGQPQPGTPGGGRLPQGTDIDTQQALSLVPAGTVPVAIFPPFATERTYPAISVIFSETHEPQAKYNRPFRRYKRKYQQNTDKVNYGFRTIVFLVSGESCVQNLNCDSEGYKLAQPRQLNEEFQSEAPVDCRAEVDPTNACLQFY